MIPSTAQNLLASTSAGRNSGDLSATTETSLTAWPRSRTTPSTSASTKASLTPEQFISDLLAHWTPVTLPTTPTPRWLRDLAQELADQPLEGPMEARPEESEKQWAERLKKRIRDEFAQHQMNEATSISYLSSLKTMLVNNGVLVTPGYMEQLEKELNGKHPALLKLMKEQPHHLSRHRLHLLIWFPLRLKCRFLRKALKVDGAILSKGIKGRVKAKQTNALLTRTPLTVWKPASLLKWALEGLELHYDTGRLLPALLLVSGRRSLTLLTSIEKSWNIGNFDPNGHYVEHTEWVKKRGKLTTSIIPLLAPWRTFSRALTALHHHFACSSVPVEQRQAVFGPLMRTHCATVPFVESCAGSVRPCDLRAIYAAYVAHHFRFDSTAIASVHAALTHSRPSTAIHYLRCNLEWEKEKTEAMMKMEAKMEAKKLEKTKKPNKTDAMLKMLEGRKVGAMERKVGPPNLTKVSTWTTSRSSDESFDLECHSPEIGNRMLRAIEFDKEEFTSIEDCANWLKNSPQAYLLNLRGFQLRPRKFSTYLSFEKRPVFYFVSSPDLWKETLLRVVRPARGVCYLESASGSDLFTESQIPKLLPLTIEKREKAEKKKEETARKALERKEEQKRKRAEETKKRKSPERATEKDEKTSQVTAPGTLSQPASRRILPPKSQKVNPPLIMEGDIADALPSGSFDQPTLPVGLEGDQI